MGFIGKLFAEVLEELNEKQVEAVRATGAGFFSVLIMAVMPQVFARFIGLSAYQFDSNLRNSTMVGIVGGGGIGAALFTAYQRFDYDVVLTILIVIIALIMLAELLANGLKKIFR
jgi:phosphonate transport system permease protein